MGAAQECQCGRQNRIRNEGWNDPIRNFADELYASGGWDATALSWYTSTELDPSPHLAHI